MKFLSLLFICLFSGGVLQAQNLKTEMDSLSYSVGVLLAQSLKQQGLDKVDAATVVSAIEDVMNDAELKISPQEANETMRSYMTALKEAQVKANAEEGKKFLVENAKRKEVTVLESGLQYEVLKAGDGPIPSADKTVSVHYHGTLINGTVFDSSVDRGTPASFPVTGVIKGWVEALQLMPTGSKWKLFIPSDLAYGERGAGGAIGPNATLIFEVELLEIK